MWSLRRKGGAGSSMISNDKKRKILSQIKEIEDFVISRRDRATTIAALREDLKAESAKLAKSNDSLAPILRTSLVINNTETAMESRYKRFRTTFPEISTLSALKRVMDRDPLDFCKTYLNINATSDKNPKYCLLRELTDGFLEYQKLKGLSSEIDAIRQWSKAVGLKAESAVNFREFHKYLKNDDPIGRRRGVGPAVVQNIRLCLGESVGKTDRHINGVMKKFLKIENSTFEEFARFIGEEPRYLDYILFKYGQAEKISA